MLPHQKTSSCSPQLFLLLLRCQWVLIQNAFFVLLLLLLSCFVSNSVQSHRRQPNRLPVPGILQARTLEWVAISFSNAWKWSRSVVSDSQQPHGLQPTRLLRPWDFPGKSTGVGCHCLLLFLAYFTAKLFPLIFLLRMVETTVGEETRFLSTLWYFKMLYLVYSGNKAISAVLQGL